jgi:hypothetical protein
MKWFPIVSAVAMAAAAFGQPGGGRDAEGVRPPVLAGSEPVDSMVVTLPGAPEAPARFEIPAPAGPRASARPGPAPSAVETEHRPVLRRAPKPVLPAEFERDSGFFVQKLIGAWTDRDAYNLFGDPLRTRDSLDDDRNADGRIFAYSDPTGRYREIELDFAKDTGLLRTVFVYPWKMSWAECRRNWGVKVQSTDANKGRVFYSYVDRRLDVLVDASGNVISLGLY